MANAAAVGTDAPGVERLEPTGRMRRSPEPQCAAVPLVGCCIEAARRRSPPRPAPAAPRRTPVQAGVAAMAGSASSCAASASGSASVVHRRTYGNTTSAPRSGSSSSRRARIGRAARAASRVTASTGKASGSAVSRTAAARRSESRVPRQTRMSGHRPADPAGVVPAQRGRHGRGADPAADARDDRVPASRSPGTLRLGLGIATGATGPSPRSGRPRAGTHARPRLRRCRFSPSRDRPAWMTRTPSSAPRPSSARVSSRASTTSRPSSRTTGTISRTQYDAQPSHPRPTGAGAAAGTPGPPVGSERRARRTCGRPRRGGGVTRTRTSTSTRSSPSGRTAPGRTNSARCRPVPSQPSSAGSPAGGGQVTGQDPPAPPGVVFVPRQVVRGEGPGESRGLLWIRRGRPGPGAASAGADQAGRDRTGSAGTRTGRWAGRRIGGQGGALRRPGASRPRPVEAGCRGRPAGHAGWPGPDRAPTRRAAQVTPPVSRRGQRRARVRAGTEEAEGRHGDHQERLWSGMAVLRSRERSTAARAGGGRGRCGIARDLPGPRRGHRAPRRLRR